MNLSPATVTVVFLVLIIGYQNLELGLFLDTWKGKGGKDSSSSLNFHSTKVEIRYEYIPCPDHHNSTTTGTRGARPIPSKKLLKKEDYYYIPAETEKFVMGHLDELGFNKEDPNKSKGCTTFYDSFDEIVDEDDKIMEEDLNSVVTNDVASMFTSYVQNLEANFTRYEKEFKPVHDIMKAIKRSSQEDIPNICKLLRPHKVGSIDNFFANSGLSYSSKMGYMEPLLPPMRHPRFCVEREKYKLSLDYLVHDFEAMCNALKPFSKLVMIDMGAGKQSKTCSYYY